MYRKRIYLALLIGWLIVIILSVYSIKIRQDIGITGAAIADMQPIPDAYLNIILVFSVFILLLVGVYFQMQHSKAIK